MSAAPVRVRLQTDAFTGLVPLHCHYLVHEDQGMLATIRIEGVEGTPFRGADELDARCYRTATPGAWVRVEDSVQLQAAQPSATTFLAPPVEALLAAALASIVMARRARGAAEVQVVL